jgi:hypothetical protein
MLCLFDEPAAVDGTVFWEGALITLSVGSSASAGFVGCLLATEEGDSTPGDVLVEALRVARLSERAVNVLLD